MKELKNDDKNTMFAIPAVQPDMQTPPVVSNNQSSETDKIHHYKLWLYGIAVGFLGLLVITGFTLLYSLNSNQSLTVTAPNNSSSSSLYYSNVLTGGDDTPASKSRVNQETKLTIEWLKKHFSNRPNVLNPDGTCNKTAICSEISDPDQDGLLNIYEFHFGTDPNDPDTDKDGLTDPVELFVYHTNPKKIDSNEDLISDLDAVINCKDPISSGLLTEKRKAQISSDLTLYPLKQPTIQKMKDAGATEQDILKFGYKSSACDAITHPANQSSSSSLPQ